MIVSWDTVRRDHVSLYGASRDTTPTLARLGKEGVVFDDAVAQQTNTAPSHGSLFTGLYPHTHGSLDNLTPIVPEVTTLAEALQQQGFRTAGFVSGLPMKSEISGLDRGFEVWDDDVQDGGRRGDETTDRALAWLEDLPLDEPGSTTRFFLFVHLYDAHGPYHTPPSHAGLFRSETPGERLARIPPYQVLHDPSGRPIPFLNGYVDRYDTLIRYQDDQLKRLLEALPLGRTAIVVLSDHGEVLGERYWPLDHGASVFEEEIRIPLVLAAPGLEPGRFSHMVETVDLAPTLLEILRAPPLPEPVDGASFLSRLQGLEGEREPQEELAFASARAVPERHADRGYELDRARLIHTVRGPRWKLILYPKKEGGWYSELYDLEGDPGETVNRAEERPEVLTEYQRHLARWLRSGRYLDRRQRSLDSETLERLRALGYVG